MSRRSSQFVRSVVAVLATALLWGNSHEVRAEGDGQAGGGKKTQAKAAQQAAQAPAAPQQGAGAKTGRPTPAQRKAAGQRNAARQQAKRQAQQAQAAAPAGLAAAAPMTLAAPVGLAPVQQVGPAVTPGDLYFGGIYPNYANSPLPMGPVTRFTINSGGLGYTSPVVVLTDTYTNASETATATVTGGAITAVSAAGLSSRFIAPVVTITDATGVGADVTAHISPLPGTGIRKFVDTLPGLCALGAVNGLGQCLPLATPDKTTFPGSDFYRIGLSDYRQQMHSDLPATTLRGYVEIDANGNPVGQHQYLGPVILAQRNRPVRVLFQNQLPVSSDSASNLFIPMDSTYMGAGMGPDGSTYSQNRADLHLHGGNSPWISDGTAHQWITPANDPVSLKKGLSFQNVPDMVGAGSPLGLTSPNDGDGVGTYYWTNQQSGRMMFYHDHAYGITRLNVYAGEAAGYLLIDPKQESMLKAASVPGTIPADAAGNMDLAQADLTHLVPLVIQDKAFVDANTIARQDPTWRWGSVPGQATTGDLWYPHVYMTNQWPDAPDLTGANAMGRWDYGPWFWPPQDPSTFNADGQPFPCTTGADATFPNVATTCPGTPNPTGTPEAFVDTPLVNGTAYPVLHVSPEAYRFQMLAAGNDRAWNFQLYQAYDPTTGQVGTGTEVKMVPASVGTWPPGWPTADGRDGGFPDPATVGPQFVQIATEGGLLPAPAVIQNRPIGFEYNRRNIIVLDVKETALLLGPAERADVIVDFTNYAGKTLILYNDAPSPNPAFDPRNDYYTGDPDQTASGGAPTTLAGYGPNTRTVMQIVVDQPSTGAAPFNLGALQSAMSAIFKATQDPMLVPETAYGDPTNTYSSISANSLTFKDPGSAVATVHPMLPKAIQELFTVDYGRMNATLGIELPFTNFMTQTTIPLGFVDPPTEIVGDGEMQIWKITHNGVDTHAIHFHLFNVQILNRVGWDGAIYPPMPQEMGWKDTVMMHPLQDIIVALKPLKQSIPWDLPNSIRPLDVTQPVGFNGGTKEFTGVDNSNMPVTVTNELVNFGWEYVWHCHLLGHEENDMMRPIIFGVAPKTPTNPSVAWSNGHPVLSFTDDSNNETAFIVDRSTTNAFTPATTTTFTCPAQAGVGAAVSCTDSAAANDGTSTYYYRVKATNVVGNLVVPNMGGIGPNTYPAGTNLSSGTYSSGYATMAPLAPMRPVAAVSPLTLAFGIVGRNTTSAAQTVTISNTGNGSLSVGTITLGGTNPNQFAQTNTCVGGVAPGASCTISVTFRPTSTGAKSATLTIGPTNETPARSFTVTLSGTGSNLRITPTSLAFGNQMVNTTSAAQSFTITNVGNTAVTGLGTSLAGTNANNFAVGTGAGACGNRLQANATCTIYLTFTPSAIGARSATLNIASSDPASPMPVALAGTGTAPVLSTSPLSLTFSSSLNTASAAQVVTVSNTGTAPMTISGVALGGTNANQFARTTTCGASLAAGASCTASVTFTPTSTGNKTATLAVNVGAPATSQTVTLSGSIPMPVLSLSSTNLVFASALNTASAAQVVTVSNTGTLAMSITGLVLGGTNANQFANASTCGATLAAGASCTASITFTPTSMGNKSATLAVNVGTPAVSQTVTLTGSVPAPALTLTPTNINFGNVTRGQVSGSTVVTVQNSGTATMTISGITLSGTNASQFGITASTCTTSLAAGTSCTVSVRFAPPTTGGNTAGLKNATLNVNVGAPATSGTVSLVGAAR